MHPPADAPLTLEHRLVRERPQGRARRLARACGAALVGSCGVAMVLSAIYPTQSSMPQALSIALGFAFVSVFGLCALAALHQVWAWVAPRVRKTVTASPEALALRSAWGRRVIPLGTVAAGWTLRTLEHAEVELELRGGDLVSVEVRSQHEADALLDAANVAPEERALTMRLGSPALDLGLAAASLPLGACVSSMLAYALSVALSMPSASLGFLMFTLTALSVGFSQWAFGPPTVRVGRDGVSVRRGRGRDFFAYTDLSQVSVQPTAVTLHLLDGRVHTIPAWGTPAARRDALGARIADALGASRAPRDLSARLATLDRGGRDLAEWRAALDAIPEARDDYRQAALSRDELLAAVEDPLASGDRRVAAAYVLSKLDRDVIRERVRVAVETVANEPVRIALSLAAEGALDEESLVAVSTARVRVG